MIVTDFKSSLDMQKVVLELCMVDSTPTKSGLFKVDSKSFGKYTQELAQEIIEYLPGKVGSSWAMIHKPGGGSVLMHTHNSWCTAVFYPVQSDSGLLLDRGVHFPKAGDLVTLEQGESHGVGPNFSPYPRYSVVFLYG